MRDCPKRLRRSSEDMLAEVCLKGERNVELRNE